MRREENRHRVWYNFLVFFCSFCTCLFEVPLSHLRGGCGTPSRSSPKNGGFNFRPVFTSHLFYPASTITALPLEVLSANHSQRRICCRYISILNLGISCLFRPRLGETPSVLVSIRFFFIAFLSVFVSVTTLILFLIYVLPFHRPVHFGLIVATKLLTIYIANYITDFYELWGSNSGDLGSVEYPVSAITPKSIKTRSISSCYRPVYGSNKSVRKLFGFYKTLCNPTTQKITKKIKQKLYNTIKVNINVQWTLQHNKSKYKRTMNFTTQ